MGLSFVSMIRLWTSTLAASSSRFVGAVTSSLVLDSGDQEIREFLVGSLQEEGREPPRPLLAVRLEGRLERGAVNAEEEQAGDAVLARHSASKSAWYRSMSASKSASGFFALCTGR